MPKQADARGPSGAAADGRTLAAPSKLLLLAEGRALVELGLGFATLPALLAAKRGDGHPVLVLPGYLASDRSTELLRRYLGLLGYAAHGWELGTNRDGFDAHRQHVGERLSKLYAQTGRTVSLVGWSLGGVFARHLAHEQPAHVRYVITLGSPISPSETNASPLYRATAGGAAQAARPSAQRVRMRAPLPVPTTAIFSKSDGVVNWRASTVEPSERAENVEVYASHVGLGVNPSVLWAIADRLAQPEGTFAPFGRGGPFGFAYPR